VITKLDQKSTKHIGNTTLVIVEACMYRLSLSLSVNCRFSIDLDNVFFSAKGLLSMSFSRSGGAHIELDSSLGDEDMSKKRSS
jgi:hypothetical protein